MCFVQVARGNVRVSLSDVVTIQKLEDVKTGKRVVVVPFADTIEGIKVRI
jgi:hypothetical protein